MKQQQAKPQALKTCSYECMFIIANDVTEEKRNVLVDKFSKMAGSNTKVEKLGLKKFATEINYKKEGYYYLMYFSATSDTPKKIGDLMNITDGIVRYIFVNKDEQKAPRAPKKVKPVPAAAEAKKGE